MSDIDLLAYYKLKEDKECVGELYKRYASFVFSICLKYLKNKDEARETTLEIYESLMEKLLNFEISNFRSWLYSMSKNYCLNLLRKRKISISYEENMNFFQESFMEDEAFMHPTSKSKEENLVLLEKCIEELKPEQRECIDLFYLQNKSYTEVVELSGHPMKKVKSYLQNGKRNLKILMEKDYE